MKDMTATEIGRRLVEAFHLNCRPVCVFGTDDIAEGKVPLGKVDRCVARAIYTLSANTDTPSFYFGKEAREGVCGGGQGWLGLVQTPPKLKYLISIGSPDFMNGAAEYLKAEPEMAERFFQAPGKITPPARFMNFAAYDQLTGNENILSLIFFGTGEQIRNLGGLIHFRSEDIFTSILMPGGPICASLVTYAAGMSEKAPKNSSYVGPVDPTGNAWFPENMMSMAVPIHIARLMAEDIDASFISKRPEIAMPSKRLGFGEKVAHF
jgi:hypothetical protein